MMKKVKVLLVLLGLGLGLSAQIHSDAAALNKAGKQRMLSQRIMKDYLLIGANIKKENAQKELDNAISTFEESFIELQDYVTKQEIQNALAKVEEIWFPFRMSMVSAPSKEMASTLIDDADRLLNACNLVVSEIQKTISTESAELVNKSGRQRMLSQRIALYYTAFYWNVNNSKIIPELTNSIDEFDKAINYLSSSDKNTDEIKLKLNKVNQQWNFSKKSFDHKSGRIMPSLIYVTTNSILKRMDKITQLYQKLTEDQE